LNLFGVDASDLTVMEAFSMVAEPLGETQNGVAADLAQPGCGADAAALGKVRGDGHEFSFRRSQTEQGRVGAFGEVGAAGGAAQTADVLAAAGPAVQTQVAGTALAVGGAVGVGAGDVRVVRSAHGFPPFAPGCYHSTQPGPSRKPYGATTEDPMSKLLAGAKRFLRDDDGPTAVEYAVMLALIIVVCITAITTLGTNANATFTAVGAQVGKTGS
jgi:pilus assembly protein Flp/PilA